jgi:hypothetical protein
VKLLQSIFGGNERRGRYPESLVNAAIERTVEGTDARLRAVPNYKKHLRQPVIQAIDHVVALVDHMAAPLGADRRSQSLEPRLAAIFASAPEMLSIFARDAALTAYLATPEGSSATQITALLLAERIERRILGMDVVGDRVRRDVQQVTVSFAGHRLVDPSSSEEETRRQLKRRAFDHLLTLALARIADLRVERQDLLRQRDLIRRKQKALEQGGWCFEAPADGAPDPTALEAELDGISAQLEALGVEGGVLRAHLGIVADLLGQAEGQLWAEDLVLSLDSMNIRRDTSNPSARSILFRELHNARGRTAITLPISLTPSELPRREDFLTAAQRYL